MKQYLLQLGIASFVFGLQLVANPSGPDVIEGDVSFDYSGSTLTITCDSARSIINWDDFSIDSADTTNIVLPDEDAVVLHRVTSTNVSNLLGFLNSNGNVYIVNENGAVIGLNSVISSNGLLVAALEVLNEQFLEGGNMNFFTNATNSVVNYGVINSTGDVILIAPFLENSGTVIGSEHFASLGAGIDIEVKPGDDSSVISVFLGGNTSQVGTGLVNSGYVEARHIEVQGDGNPYALTISHSGWLNATSVAEANVDVVVFTTANNNLTGATVNINGLMTAVNPGQNGGNVTVSGNSVTLDQNCYIDCSANLQGGNAFIGGSWQNTDPSVMNALTTTVVTGARVDVSCRYFGNAGTCVVWADDSAYFYGIINASGGAFSGDGGFVEVCGVNYVDSAGDIDVSAVNGAPGVSVSCP